MGLSNNKPKLMFKFKKTLNLFTVPLSLTDGSRTEAEFGNPAGLLIDERDPTKIIVMDDMNHAIRSVDISTGVSSYTSQLHI